MKKFFIFLVVALAVSWSAWGQIPTENRLYRNFYQFYSNLYYSIFDLTDLDSGVPTTFTESRYSASRFGSPAGGFVDPRGYNPGIGTFFFMGAFPGGASVDNTSYLTPGSPVQVPNKPGEFFFLGGSYAVSAGFGKSIGNNGTYLAAYYGGSLVEAFGQTTKNGTDPDKYDTFSFATWRNKMAILLGVAGMGFRLDMIMNSPQSQKVSTEDGKEVVTQLQNGTAVALTWGTHMGKFSPYANFVIKFADSVVVTEDAGKKMTMTAGSKWGFSTGTGYPITDHSSIWVDFLLGGLFKNSLSGDSEALDGVKPYKDGGSFGIGLKAGYSRTFELGKLSLGLGPQIRVGSTYLSRYSITDAESDKYPLDNFFDFAATMDIGLRYRANDRFAFYTGAGLRFLELNVHSLPGGKGNYKTKEYEWQLSGIDWQGYRLLPGGELGFGMTFNPSPYLTIGFGLNSVLDNLFKINIRKMTLESGSFWGADYDSFSSWASSIFDTTKFDMTVSLRVPPGGIPAGERRTFKDFKNDSKVFKFFRDARDFREFRKSKASAESETPITVPEPEAVPVEQPSGEDAVE